MLKALSKLLFGERKKEPQAPEVRQPEVPLTKRQARDMLSLRRLMRSSRSGSDAASLASVKAKLPKSWFTKKWTPGRERVWADAFNGLSPAERRLVLYHAPREWRP